ncbi:hypothetical protein [Mycobacterium hubeiense]|uniref:hypothetical protein n=1 Tax=Mycobacterium hubeiense TaxID=1867256 RepID=UPI001E305164|nr:hypothetical protein [Mycobacterium sp. QGD 101]
MIAVSVVATVLVLRPDSAGSNRDETPTATADSEVASANDTGPANIITEDPTCEAWGRIGRDYVAQAKEADWAERDPSLPASEWTPEQRATYEAMGKAMSDSADLAVNLSKRTPHRVMRHLYAQFVAYARAFVDSIPAYEPASDALANVTGALMSGISNMCSAVDYKAVQPVAPVIPAPSDPTQSAPAVDEPKRFLEGSNSICGDWMAASSKYSDDTDAWQSIDAAIPATDWKPEQRSVYDAVGPVMTDHANDMERLGIASGNPILEDIATLAAQYTRAYVIAIPKYTQNDNFMSQSARYLASTVYWACKTVS